MDTLNNVSSGYLYSGYCENSLGIELIARTYFSNTNEMDLLGVFWHVVWHILNKLSVFG